MAPGKYIKFGLFNAGSLATNQDEFLIAMGNHSVDIMAINETWLRSGEEDRAPSISGYKFRHIPRPVSTRGGRGGGVAFYIRNGINARVKAHPEHPSVEQLWLGLTINKTKLLIGTAYRPPWQDLELFLDAITASISALAPYDNVIILGDINVNLLHTNSAKSRQLMGFFSNFNLTQIVTTATHFVNNSCSLIDIVCTDAFTRNVKVNHISELGHHAFITTETVFRKPRCRPRIVRFRPLADILPDYFLKDLNMIPWSDIGGMGDVDNMVYTFNSYITQLFDLHAPLKTKTYYKRPTPWLTDNIRLIFKLRDEARQRCRETKLPHHKQYYLDLKNESAAALVREKTAYFTKNINEQSKDPKLLWQNLKSDVLPDHKDKRLPSNFDNPDSINAAFLNVPGTSSDNILLNNIFKSSRYSSARFSLTSTNQETVLGIIRGLGSKAQGVDGISLDMLTLTLPNTLQAITDIINKSIETCTFPSLWRHAVVCPIPKTGEPVTFKDLRPISILPCLSKILERVVYLQVIEYLEANSILPEFQSGFRKGRGTATALMDVVGNILEARDRGEGSILVLLDFSRAFDAINTNLLLSKLTYYGFDGASVDWFNSYLTDRSQLVQIHKEDGSTISSFPLPVTRGVPQGSILGPLLYILYSADITKSFLNCRYHMYADDIQLYTSFKGHDVVNAVHGINEDLQRIVTWSEENCLLLNPLKSKFMVLGTKKQVANILSAKPRIVIKGEKIECVEQACSLGLTLDQELHFEAHINNTARNCFYRLKVLYGIRNFLSLPLRKQLVDSLVLSKLNYCDTVYGPCLLARTDRLIQRIQNACVRFCIKVPRRQHVTPYTNQIKFLKMTARRKLHLASLMFGIVTTQKPHYLYEKLTWKQTCYKHGLRSVVAPLKVPPHKTAAFRGSFKFAATHCWNDLPPPLRDLKTINSFKLHLKKALLDAQVSQ
uniref:Reverse transcriptase domain-containing protein n=1 Tax=Heliothis virescens TaxID=7102 RepID=A0A2A4IWQ4_HELVI